MYNLDEKKNKIENVVKVLAICIIGFVVAPFVFLSIQGLIGLIVAGAIAFAAIKFTPWFAAKISNWQLKAIKHEAMKNPIETLQNDYNNRVQALQSFRESIRNFAAEIGTFKDKLEGFKKQWPDQAAKFNDQYNQMLTLLDLRKTKYEQAKENIASYSLEIDKARGIWEMAQAAAQMNKAAGVDADEFFAKIQVETALDSVQKSLNGSFADLEISLLDEKGKQTVTKTPVAALPEAQNKNSLDLDINIDTNKILL